VGISVLGGLLLLFVGGLWLLVSSVRRPEVWGVILTGLLLAIAFGAPAIILVVYLDRREPEPWWLLVLGFLWGAVVATAMALVLEGAASQQVVSLFADEAGLVDTTQLGYQFANPAEVIAWVETSLIAPVVEEGLKALALLLIFFLLPTEATSMRDGIVYGALVGLGFAVLETAAFIASGYSGTGSADYMSQLIPRFVLFGVNGHALYTALFGAGLGLARQSMGYGSVRKTLIVLGGFLLALAAHTTANAFGPFALSAFATIASAGPTVTVAELWLLNLATLIATNVWAYVVIASLATRSGYWELRVCQTELVNEGPPAVTSDERALVEGEGLWRLRRVPGLSRVRSNHLVRAQNELAFRRNDVRRAGSDPGSDRLVGEWRAVIAGIREESV
jgi:RsiW-degrading membrane proteinase PrsW (M82 family)